MEYQVRVVEVGDDIEEEVSVEVAGHLIKCFANVCPYPIAPGQIYRASLTLWAADGLALSEVQDEAVGITRVGSGFKHRVVGVLNGITLDAGVQFDDDMFASEYQFLEGKLVCAEVDRIQLEFE